MKLWSHTVRRLSTQFLFLLVHYSGSDLTSAPQSSNWADKTSLTVPFRHSFPVQRLLVWFPAAVSGKTPAGLSLSLQNTPMILSNFAPLIKVDVTRFFSLKFKIQGPLNVSLQRTLLQLVSLFVLLSVLDSLGTCRGRCCSPSCSTWSTSTCMWLRPMALTCWGVTALLRTTKVRRTLRACRHQRLLSLMQLKS